MSRHPALRRKSTRPRMGRLAVQSLESRGMLAGDVSVSISAGNVSISGDGSDNKLTVTHLGADLWEVAGVGGTTINGGPSIQFEVGVDLLFNLTINLKGGNDIITVDGNATGTLPGNLSVGGAEGDNDITVTGIDVIAGKLGVVNSFGNDTVVIDSINSVQSISVTNGKGGANVTIGGGGPVFVTKDVGVTALDGQGNDNDVALDGITAGGNVDVNFAVSPASSMTFDNMTVTGNLSFRHTGGNVTATLGGTANTIGGKLTVDLADGDHTITLDDIDIGKDLFIRTKSGTKTIDIDTTNVDGHVQINNGGGTETIDITAANIGAGAGKGNLLIKNDGGDSDTDIHGGTIDGNVSIIHGTGDATVTLGSAAALAVSGSVSIRNGNANAVGADVTIDDLTAKDLSITSGAGDNTIAIGGSATVSLTGGSLTIKNGNGDSSVTINDTDVLRDLSITNAISSTVNTVTIGDAAAVTVGRNFGVTDGNGASALVVDKLAVTGALSFRGNQGSDNVTLEDDFSAAKGGNIDTGADADAVIIAAGADLTLGKATIQLGQGDDSLSIADAAGSFNLTARNYLFDGGLGGTDVLDLDIVFTPLQLAKVKNFETIM